MAEFLQILLSMFHLLENLAIPRNLTFKYKNKSEPIIHR